MKPIITSLQLFLMLFIIQTGTVFISFQSQLVIAVGRDAWWLFLVLGMFILPHLLLYERYYQDFNWSRPISFLYGLYWFYTMASFLGYTGYTLNAWAYPKTPTFVVLMLIVIVLFYLTSSPSATAINMGVILIPMIVLFIVSLYLGVKQAVWTNLLPLGEASLKELQKGMMKAQLPFIGIELYLLLRNFVPGKLKKWKIAAYSGIWLLFFLQMLIIPLLFFALEEFRLIPEPIMYLLKSQDVAFMERLDLLFIYIWLAWSFVTLGIYAFSVMELLPERSKNHRIRNSAWLCILLLAVGSQFGTKEIVRMNSMILQNAHFVFAVLLPFLIIFYNRTLGRKRKEETA